MAKSFRGPRLITAQRMGKFPGSYPDTRDLKWDNEKPRPKSPGGASLEQVF